ncbi:CMRF35-like molecule 1 [Tiliqua scincoides]|uniref:CMRF35-like molecule 1 n=1 Tax=Tiliqua scincoides TaxID=71010 RepID=UPI003462D12E
MDNLQLEDSGTYQCGIERLVHNTRHGVTVTVSPAPTLKPEEKPVTTEPPGPDPAMETATDVTKSTLSPKEELNKPTAILIYCIAVIFSLLLLATVVLVMMSRKKRTGSCLPRRKKETKPSNIMTVYSTVDAPRENLVPDHPTSSNGTGLYSNAEISPESNDERIHSQRKALEKRNEVTYATLMISDLQQEAIYGNVDSTPRSGLPQTPTQDVFYTEVKKKSPKC